MTLLFDEDYQILKDAGLTFTEDEASRFFIFRDFPLPEDVYTANGQVRATVDVLYAVPPDYNTSGGDMFWVHPQLARADSKPIPNIGTTGPNQDSRTYAGVEYTRWSRHWHQPGVRWKPKVDDIRVIIDRITWAFSYPDAKRP
ncbi:E2/UBC family protein [Mesorhizobium sp. M0118]|uniref:E2/UBC family protein n=1 Tax=Mesorhizobium sp. M0118 TaxID=2956884 RepID=UPI00333CDD0F